MQGQEMAAGVDHRGGQGPAADFGSLGEHAVEDGLGLGEVERGGLIGHGGLRDFGVAQGLTRPARRH